MQSLDLFLIATAKSCRRQDLLTELQTNLLHAGPIRFHNLLRLAHKVIKSGYKTYSNSYFLLTDVHSQLS
jgi:hypothetical protein